MMIFYLIIAERTRMKWVNLQKEMGIRQFYTIQ